MNRKITAVVCTCNVLYKELYIILHLFFAHLAWGRLCAAGRRLHPSLQRGTAVSWCLLALPPGSCPDELAQVCAHFLSVCSGASIPALLPGWANVHWNSAQLLPSFQEQNWAPINLLLSSACSRPSAQDWPGGINSATPVMLLGISLPGPPGRNRDFPISTVLDKETAPERETGIQSCSLHWLQLSYRCSQRSGRMLPKRKQQIHPLHSTSHASWGPSHCLNHKTIPHPCKKWWPAWEGKKPGIYSWLCKHTACTLPTSVSQWHKS